MTVEYLAGKRVKGLSSEKFEINTTVGNLTDVSWGSVSGVTDNGLGRFTKSGAEDWNAGAITSQTITTMGSFTGSSTSSHWVMGIDPSTSTAQWSNKFEIHPTWTPSLIIYDKTSGTNVGSEQSLTWSSSTVFKLTINSVNKIEVYADNILKYTSTNSISSPMYGRAYSYTAGQVTMDYTPLTYKSQNGTVFEETDTNKSYIWNSSTSTWTQF